MALLKLAYKSLAWYLVTLLALSLVVIAMLNDKVRDLCKSCFVRLWKVRDRLS